MCNNTLNEDDYKEAVRSKFEKEKDGIYSNYLNNPSQANLRDLCWKIFKSNEKTDDLNAYSDFFKFKFDSNNEDTSTTYTDKFKKVGRFFKGETKPAKIDTINFAAVLVDFEFRPFGKFKKHYPNDQKNAEEENDFMDEIETVQESEIESEVKNEDSIVREELNKNESSWEKENLNKTAFHNEERDLRTDEILIDNETPKQEDILISLKANAQLIKPEEFLDLRKELPQEKIDKTNRNKWIRIGVVSFLVVLGWYCFPQKKECMQWTSDHYEIVDCDLKKEGFMPTNAIEVLDPGLVNLKKITICDTTTCFDKNGVAIIWYAKTANGVDFFNSHGMHPENNKPLKPVTRYILEKYVK